MDTLEAIRKRTSTRAYKPEQISDQDLETIISAGCAAPVASSKYHSLHITVIQNDQALKLVTDAASDFVSKLFGQPKSMDFGAKTLVLVSSTVGAVPGIEYANVGCVLENMALAATALGIDHLIWGAAAAAVAQNETLKNQLAIPDGYTPLLCASFGYAVSPGAPKEHTIVVNRI